jgi:hypothetical protein
MEVSWETWLCLRFVISTPRNCSYLKGRHWYSPTILQYFIAQKTTTLFFHLLLSSLYFSFSFLFFTLLLVTSYLLLFPPFSLLRSFSSSLHSFVLAVSHFFSLSSISPSSYFILYVCFYLPYVLLLLLLLRLLVYSSVSSSTRSFFVRIVTRTIMRPERDTDCRMKS